MIVSYKLHCKDIHSTYLFWVCFIYLFITKFRKHIRLKLSPASYQVDSMPDAKKEQKKNEQTKKTFKNQTKV